MVSELAERFGNTLNEASARSILSLKLDGPTLERRQELATKANEGSLTAEEFAEYETYAQLRALLAVLQSKAYNGDGSSLLFFGESVQQEPIAFFGETPYREWPASFAIDDHRCILIILSRGPGGSC